MCVDLLYIQITTNKGCYIFFRISRACCRSRQICNLSLPTDITGFIWGQGQLDQSPVHMTSQDRLSAPDLEEEDDDADVPMLIMDDPMEQFFGNFC